MVLCSYCRQRDTTNTIVVHLESNYDTWEETRYQCDNCANSDRDLRESYEYKRMDDIISMRRADLEEATNNMVKAAKNLHAAYKKYEHLHKKYGNSRQRPD